MFSCSWSAVWQDVCMLSQSDEFTGISDDCWSTESKMQRFPTAQETLEFAFCERLGLSDYLESKERWKEGEILFEKTSFNGSKHFTLFTPALIITDSKGHIFHRSVMEIFNLFQHGHKALILEYLGREITVAKGKTRIYIKCWKILIPSFSQK